VCQASIATDANLRGKPYFPDRRMIVINESQPMALRATMYRELAQYVAPKRKALEHKGEMAGSSPPVFGIDIGEKPE
jgi:hypothetical protein